MRYITIASLAILFLAQVAAAADSSFAITKAELTCQAGNPQPVASSLDFLIDKSLNPDELIECDGNDQKCKDRRRDLAAWISSVLRNPTNYHLMEIKSGVSARLDSMAAARSQALDNTVTFAVSNYDLSGTYVLVAKDLAFEEKAPALVPFMIKVTANSSCDRVPDKLPDAEKPAALNLKAPSFKEYFAKPAVEGSPRLTVDFSMQGTKRKKVVSNFNVKF